MEPVLATLALFTFGGLITCTMLERKHRTRWRLIDHRPIAREPGRWIPFRVDAGPAPTEPVLVRQRAPKAIRRTALWSIYMGQMAIPGGLLGLFGLVAAGIGLVSIPGMILAVRIWMLAGKMLRRDPGAELEARRLAEFAVVLNVIGCVVAGVLVLFGGWDLVPVSLILVVYALVSFAHAVAMVHCADLLAADTKRRAAIEARARARAEANPDAPTRAGWRPTLAA